MGILSVINHKGGVGKTTLCVNLAQALAILGKKVLCIDNDSQHSMSNRLGVKVGAVNIRNLYRGEISDYNSFLQSAVFESAVPNLHCITSTMALCNGDISSVSVLADLINNSFISQYYDFVFIDNHPGLDNLQRVSIAASTRLIVPVLLKQQSMEGLSEMMELLTSLSVPTEKIAIIPNVVENLKDQKLMFQALHRLYPANIPPATLIVPLDRIVETVEREQKVIFLDRLQSSTAAVAFIKMIVYLFPELNITFDEAYNLFKKARDTHRSEISRQNLQRQRGTNESK